MIISISKSLTCNVYLQMKRAEDVGMELRMAPLLNDLDSKP